MSIVTLIEGQWHVKASPWIARVSKREWTPLHLGSGYSEADAIAKAESLGILAVTSRPKIRRVK